MLTRTLLAFLFRDAKTTLSYRFSLILDVFSVFFSVTTFYFVSKLFGSEARTLLSSYGGDYFSFVVIGLAFSSYQSVGLTSFSQSLRQEQYLGTLESIMMTPISIPRFLVSSSLWDFLYATFEVIIYFVLGFFLFKLSLDLTNVLTAVCFLILTISAFMSFGILSAAFILIYKKGNPVTWLLVSLSELLGGVYFPASVLPEWLRHVSFFIPMTHALEGLRGALLTGKNLFDLRIHALALAGFTFLFLPIGVWFFKRALDRVRREGSLGHY